MSFPVRINFERELDETFMQGLFELVDTGIAYWACLDEKAGGTEFYNDDGKTIIAINVAETEWRAPGQTPPDAEEIKTQHRIEGETFRQGFQRLLSGAVPINTAQLGHIAVAFITTDISMLDGEDVDLIVQAGIYNDIIWG